MLNRSSLNTVHFWINQLDEYIEKYLEQHENMQYITKGSGNVDIGLSVFSAEIPLKSM